MAAAVSPDLMAQAVIDAAITSVPAAAEKYGVTRKTIYVWRKAVGSNPAVLRAVTEKKAAADRAWAEQIPACLEACIDYLHRAAVESQNKTPEMVHAIAGALKMVSEVAATWKVLDVHLERFRGGAVPKVLPFLPAGGNGNGDGKAAATGE